MENEKIETTTIVKTLLLKKKYRSYLSFQ